MKDISAYWFLPLLVQFIGFFIYYLDIKKRPPYVEKQKDKSNSDYYVVNVITFTGYGPNVYRGYSFVKNKDGEFRFKHDLSDWIGIILSTLMLGGIYVFVIIQNQKFSVDPINMKNIIFYLIVLLILLGYFALFHCSKIIARIYFRKHFKDFK
jgi:hypothetical protein